MLKILIAEDEIKTVNLIKNILENYCSDVVIAGYVQTVKDAICFLSENKVDLVLFDINFPDGTSFDILQQLTSYNFSIIFITAFEEFALQAIKLSTTDYLLKPVNPKELIAAIQKVQIDKIINNNLLVTTLLSNVNSSEEKNKKIVLKTTERIQVVNISDIIFCKSDNSYTVFYLKDSNRIVVSKVLLKFENILKEHGFIRVHKSFLVNLDFISSYEKATDCLIMSNKLKIPVSVRKKESVLQILDTI
jgi:two-component system LytT family response regulator